MREYNKYVARVAECEQRSKAARNEGEKQSWLAMADSWRETAEPQEILQRQAQFIEQPVAIMPLDTISTDQLVTCPSCGKPMRFARTVTKLGDLPEMKTFECRLCRLSVTSEELLGIMEMASA